MVLQDGSLTNYPVSLSIDYPGRPLNRLTTFFRFIIMVPIVVILGLVTNVTAQWDNEVLKTTVASGGILFVPVVLMVLFRQKYPRWWFDWNVSLVKFSTRVLVYVMLLRDEYPSTDEDQSVHINIEYPDVLKNLNRWLPLIKWFLAIPHYFILCFLIAALFICVVIAWFAILFTGKYPETMFRFVVGVIRWNLRVSGYAFLLVTDQYPSFSLK